MKIVTRNPHLWLGLATGLIVLIVSLSGAVFALFHPELVYVERGTAP